MVLGTQDRKYERNERNNKKHSVMVIEHLTLNRNASLVLTDQAKRRSRTVAMNFFCNRNTHGQHSCGSSTRQRQDRVDCQQQNENWGYGNLEIGKSHTNSWNCRNTCKTYR